MTGGKTLAADRGSVGFSVMMGEMLEVEVIMNEVGVRRAIDENHPFSGNAIR